MRVRSRGTSSHSFSDNWRSRILQHFSESFPQSLNASCSIKCWHPALILVSVNTWTLPKTLTSFSSSAQLSIANVDDHWIFMSSINCRGGEHVWIFLNSFFCCTDKQAYGTCQYLESLITDKSPYLYWDGTNEADRISIFAIAWDNNVSIRWERVIVLWSAICCKESLCGQVNNVSHITVTEVHSS